MLVVWIVGFMVIYAIVGFPDGILETAKNVMASGMR